MTHPATIAPRTEQPAGRLGLHVAQTPCQVADLISARIDAAPTFERPRPATRAEILEALDTSTANATSRLSGWNDAARARSGG